MRAGRTVVAALVAMMLFTCQDRSPTLSSPAEQSPEPAPAASEPSPASILQKTTLAAAVEMSKPFMEDTVDDVSKGAAMLAIWSTSRLTWSELNERPPTKFALVMKDPDEERGKLLCGRGSVIEIAAEKTSAGKMHHGGMFVGSQILRFIAVGSTGELVANSWAGFCGIVIGKQTYHNSIGGVAHAAFLVGMFNLPANKKGTPRE